MGKMKEELKEFNIDVESIKRNDELFENIHKAIDKMRLVTLKNRFEVILNENLIECKEKYTNYRTIIGCRISYDKLDKDISFIVREDAKPTYEELEQRIDNAIQYITEGIKWEEEDYSNSERDLLEILKGENEEI